MLVSWYVCGGGGYWFLVWTSIDTKYHTLQVAERRRRSRVVSVGARWCVKSSWMPLYLLCNVRGAASIGRPCHDQHSQPTTQPTNPRPPCRSQIPFPDSSQPPNPLPACPCMHAHVQELRPDLAGLLGGHLELVRGGGDGQPRAPARLAGLAGVLLGKHHCVCVRAWLGGGWDGRKWAVRKGKESGGRIARPACLASGLILSVVYVFVMSGLLD